MCIIKCIQADEFTSNKEKTNHYHHACQVDKSHTDLKKALLY